MDILARGMVFEEEFLEDLKKLAEDIFETSSYKNESDRGGLKNNLKRKISRVILNKLRQRPMVLPLLIEQVRGDKTEGEE